MERELLLTGIGGQGVQLAARVLAEAAIADGLEVRLFGSYGGMMRGGNTDATLIFGDSRIETPPVIAETWSAIVMHHEFADPVWSALRPGGLALYNSSVVPTPPPEPDARLLSIAASDLAIELGNVVCAALVMVGAYGEATGMFSPAGLQAGVEAAVPAYRRQLIELNLAALETGRGAVAGALT